MVGAADLVFVLLCAAAYFGRSKSDPPQDETPEAEIEPAE